MEQSPWKNFETLQLHAGYKPDAATRSTAVPIYATSSFTFNDSAQAARLFGLRELGNIYTRLNNPTVDVFEKRIAALEGGIAALATSSGQAAQYITLTSLTRPGDNIVASSHLYGGTYNQLSVLLPRFNIKTKFIQSGNPADFAVAIDDKTKAIYIESISNPDNFVPEIQAIAKIAHDHGIPLIVDNTLGAGGYFIRPIDHGADIVLHSATKWIGGHGTTIAGVIIDSGRFNWGKHGLKFPEMVEPSPAYHGLRYWPSFGPATFIIRARMEMLRDVGPCLSPFAAQQLLIGLETLALRAERHARNTAELVAYFEAQSKHVSWILWPGSDRHPSHTTAKKYLKRGFGGMLSIGVKGGTNQGSRVVDNLKLVSNVANVGDAKSLAIHPWSTTHEQLSAEEKQASGVTEDMIRISVGIEHIDDIVADFAQAFQAVYEQQGAFPKF